MGGAKEMSQIREIIYTIIIAFTITLILGPIFIPMLRKTKIWSNNKR